MNEVIYCYTCENWVSTHLWKGKCPKHPERGDKYNTDATIRGCTDYVDKYAKYYARQEVQSESIKH